MASVGNDTVNHAVPDVTWTTRQGTVFYFIFRGGGPQLVVELDHLCEVKNLYSAKGNGSYHVVYMVRHPRGSYIVLPLPSLEVPTPEIKLIH